MHWEGFNAMPTTTSTIFTSKSDMHSIDNSIAAEAKISALMRRIEALDVKGISPQIYQVNQISAPSCFNCHTPTHVMEDCPLLPNPLMASQDQLNSTFQ